MGLSPDSRDPATDPDASALNAPDNPTSPGPGADPGGPAPGRPDPAFRDPARPLAERITDLLRRLTLPEKIALLHQHQAPVPRLGIGAFHTGTEVLHGLAWLGPATVFPQAIGLGSSWDPDLLRAVGQAVGDEARGFHHKDPQRGGLNVWAPVVNLLRDPRWGRNEEGYAEDPVLTGALATAYAQGLRGDHPRYLKTAPTLKHFLAYNNETRREETSSSMPARVLREYELPAFRAPLAAGAAVAVMASYNLVNGRPAHLSPLINAELRGWAGHDVLVVSDAQAPSNVVGAQHYYADHVDSHAALLRAGVDSFTDNDDRSGHTIDRVTEALRRGLIDESDVDTAVRHTLAIRFRLGEFDPPEGNPYAGITEDVINCPAHQRLAARAARQAIVLLRNDGTLPLPAAPGRVAVLGPLADTLYEDWYSGTLPYALTARGGLAERLGAAAVSHVEGVDRVALRVGPDEPVHAGQYVGVPDPAHGGPLSVGADGAGPRTWLDVADWGQGLVALRAAANDRYLTVDEAGAVVNEASRPGGWVVRETFALVRRGEQVLLRHVATGRYLRVEPDGVVRAVAEDAARATGFRPELVRDGVAEAAAAAAEADVAVVVLGNHPLINGRETQDRADLDLPDGQDRLLRAVYAANPRTVLVLTSSYPYAIGWADEHLPAILWSAHGGQEFGRALAEALFGDISPSGRLTQTWYRRTADLPDLLDYDIIAADATYQYFRGTPLYPFGHGLTYSPVEYANLRRSTPASDSGPAPAANGSIDAESGAADAGGGTIDVEVDVHNAGPWAVDEVVQLYSRQHTSRVKQPLRRLRAFARVPLAAGETRTVRLTLPVADLAVWDVTRHRYAVEPARHTLLAGRSAADIRCTTTVDVAGEPIPDRPALAGPWEVADFDESAGVVLCDADPAAGDAVLSTEPGGWVRFVGVDFGSDARSVTVEVARFGRGPAQVTVRRDDPLTGPVLGTVTAACAGGRYAFQPASGPATGVAGVHDVYLVFASAGVIARTVAFA